MNSNGKLAFEYSDVCIPISICRSNAGFYIGTTDECGLPISRKSLEYYPDEKHAQYALDNNTWTQRDHP